MINPNFITGNFSLQSSQFLSLRWRSSGQLLFSGCFVFDFEHFRHQHCARFSLDKLSHGDHKCRFSSCGAQFNCDAVGIPRQHINLFFGLHRGWSAIPWAVTDILSTVLRTTEPASDWANICGTLTTHASETSVNLCRTIAFRSKNLVITLWLVRSPHHRPLCTATVLNGRDWSTDDPAGAGHCPCPVGKTRNSTRRYIKKKYEGLLSCWSFYASCLMYCLRSFVFCLSIFS